MLLKKKKKFLALLISTYKLLKNITLSNVFLISRDAQTVPKAEHI